MQIAVIEFARNILGWKDANSTEFDPSTTHPVVIEMPEHNPGQMGATMRLGKRKTLFTTKNSLLSMLLFAHIIIILLGTCYFYGPLLLSPFTLGACLLTTLDCALYDHPDSISLCVTLLSYYWNLSAHTGKLYHFGHTQNDFVEERHRHRYEVNPSVIEEIEKAGLKFVGHSTDDKRMEIMELKGRDPCGHVHVIHLLCIRGVASSDDSI